MIREVHLPGEPPGDLGRVCAYLTLKFWSSVPIHQVRLSTKNCQEEERVRRCLVTTSIHQLQNSDVLHTPVVRPSILPNWLTILETDNCDLLTRL